MKLLGKRISLNYLHLHLQKLWQNVGDMEIIDFENDYFLIRFLDRRDINDVMDSGQWVIMGHYLGVQQWQPKLSPYEDKLRRISVRIRVSGLRVEYYDDHILHRIGNGIRRTIKVVDNSLKRRDNSREDVYVIEKARFARICIDASIIAGGGMRLVVGVFRDSTDSWVIGFTMNIGSSSVLLTGLWGILVALRLAWEKAFCNVVVVSDSLFTILSHP